MRIMETSARLLNPFLDELSDEFYLQMLLRHVEKCGRICYLSEPKDPEGSTEKFVRMLIKNGHESPLEHGSCTFKIANQIYQIFQQAIPVLVEDIEIFDDDAAE